MNVQHDITENGMIRYRHVSEKVNIENTSESQINSVRCWGVDWLVDRNEWQSIYV